MHSDRVQQLRPANSNIRRVPKNEKEKAGKPDNQRFKLNLKARQSTDTLKRKLEALSTRRKHLSRAKSLKVETELLVLKIQLALLKPYRFAFERISTVHRPQLTYINTSQPSVNVNSSLGSLVALTKCRNCGKSGLTLLTTSTRDNLSPRFRDKVTALMPSQDERIASQPKAGITNSQWDSWFQVIDEEDGSPTPLPAVSNHMRRMSDLPDISAIEGDYQPHQLSDYQQNQFFQSYQNENRAVPLFPYQHTTSVVSFDSEVKLLNMTEEPASTVTKILGRPNKTTFDSMDVQKGSPFLTRRKHIRTLDEILLDWYKTKLNRAFDMIFLSRAMKPVPYPTEQSLTFEFSREEGDQQVLEYDPLCNLSAIEQQENTLLESDSVLMEVSEDYGENIINSVKIL